MITFTVYGEARPAGSKRAFAIHRRDGSPVLRPNGSPVIAVVDDCKKSKSWKQQVSAAAREAYHGDLLDGPLRVSLRFFRPRPKGHYGSKGLNKKGRESIAPTTKPDCDKLSRGVLDALTKVLYVDDAQIVAKLVTKDYGEPARVEVVIEPHTA